MIELPEASARVIRKEFAEAGDAWVENYPALLQGYLDRWQLRVTGKASGGLPINQVLFVENAKGEQFALKIGVPHPEQKTEILALQQYTAQGAPVVELLDAEPEGYGILLERLVPGAMLRAKIKDEVALRGALQLHKKMPKPVVDSEFPHFRSDWMSKAFYIYRKRKVRDEAFLSYIEKSEQLYDQYCTGVDCLLHGDLHHENILLHGDRWLAIDPKGVVGPAILESGRFLHNFMPDEISEQQSREDVLHSRLRLAEEVLEVGYETLLAITFIDATLGTCWTLNSEGDGTEGCSTLAALNNMTV